MTRIELEAKLYALLWNAQYDKLDFLDALARAQSQVETERKPSSDRREVD